MPNKAPVCPWCDTPKDGVSINGIRILDNCGNQYGTKQKANFCPLCGRPLTEEAAMKRFEPMQKPLTLIDLEKCCETCDPVYVCRCGEDMPMFRGQTTIGAVLDIVPSYGQCEKVIKAIYGEKLSLCQSDYGRTWIAFRNKPTYEERKAVTV